MKTTKIIYWISTVLLILLMLSSVIGTFVNTAGGEAFAKQVQFPEYMFKMLAIAKALGIIGILIPGYPRVKEWAYAGFTFDLVGAIVLFAASPANFPVTQWAPMLVGGLVVLVISYFSWHKMQSVKQA